MLEGECGEVSIGCQVAAGAQRKQEVAQHLSVAGAWMDYGHRGLFEPGIHDVEGSFDSEWFWEHIRSCRQTKESEEDNPRKANCFRSGKRGLPPRFRFGVPRRIFIDGVDEEVDVNEDHLRSASLRVISSSSMASAMASALSQRKSGTGPRW